MPTTTTTTTEGNAFSVPVSDRKKHGGWKAMPLILEGPECGVYYDPPSKENVESKLPLTYQFRFVDFMIEFYNRQFPDNMRCIANSLIFCSLAGSSYLCSMVVNIVHHVTGGHGHPDWLTNDLNAGRLDYFYYIIAVMAFFNFVYFVYVARRYRYKGQVQTESKSELDVELSPMN
ncbi:hypothetical protein V6N12_048623 [Hibiscus sabdariffa]|uniref:Uncharacterized protein n=1 Tax=Hibiscus sabdariffa TaxID=183260 RepID=A0ABR2EK55_9ROSI